MYQAALTDKYKKRPEEHVASPNDVRRKGATDLIDIAEGVGNISDPYEKFNSVVEFLRGKTHNVLYRDYIRQVGKKLITDNYYTDSFRKIAKNIHEQLDERLEGGRQGLSKKMSEHYAVRLGALVTEAFNRSLKGDIEDPYMRMINYQHVEDILKKTVVRTQDGKENKLWDIVVSQIRNGDVQGAYHMLSKQISEGLQLSLEQTIENKLHLTDYDFRKKAGEILAEKAEDHLKGVDKFAAEGFLQEAAHKLVQTYANAGIEGVVAQLEEAGKIESKPQSKKALPFESGAADDHRYERAA